MFLETGAEGSAISRAGSRISLGWRPRLLLRCVSLLVYFTRSCYTNTRQERLMLIA